MELEEQKECKEIGGLPAFKICAVLVFILIGTLFYCKHKIDTGLEDALAKQKKNSAAASLSQGVK